MRRPSTTSLSRTLALGSDDLAAVRSSSDRHRRPKEPKPPKYKVLVVTAGDRKTELNPAGVKAIREIGRDDGTKDDPNAKFTVELAQNANQIKTFNAKQLEKFRAVIFLDTGRADLLTDAQKAALRGLLPRRRRLPRDRLGDRDRAGLAVLHRHPRHASRRPRLRPRPRPGDTNIKVASVGGLAAGNDDHDRLRRERRAGDDPDRRHCRSGRNRPHPDRTADAGPRDRRARWPCRWRRSSRRRSRSPTASTTRRRTCPSTGTGPTPGTTSRPTSAASRTCSPRSSRIRSARSRRARCSTGSPAARWAPTTRSPGARTTRAAARSTPRSATPRRASTRPTFQTHLDGRDRLGGRRGRPGLQRLRRDRARELPAGQDQRPAEPERADRLRPAPRRARHPDRPPRRRAPAQPGDRHLAGPRDRPASTRTARTACTARASTPTSRRTTGSTSTTPRRTSTTSPTPTGRPDTPTTSTRPPAGRTARLRPRPSTSPTSTPGSGTSSCRGSSSSTTPRATRRTSTWRPSSRSCASR